jgi:hypothetical protein
MLIDYLKSTWVLLLIIVAALLIFGDGAQLAVTIYRLASVALVLLLADAILDNREKWGLFPTLDLDKAIDVAIRGDFDESLGIMPGSEIPRRPNPVACSLIFLGVVILLVSILFISTGHAGTIDQAKPYLPQLSSAIDAQWPAMPLRQIAAGQVEQESGWKERATLKTSRELGRGLVQMTIAYDKTGRERFNIYREASRMRALQAWDWQHDPYNARYQLTFLVLQDRSNFSQVRPFFASDIEAHKGSLVCYNAGAGRWLQRRANAKRLGLPADRWDGGLDGAYSRGEAALLYGRPLYEAVNEYPRVIFKRAAKYRGLV